MSDQIIGREEEGKSDTDLNNLQENSTNSPSISPIPLPEPTTTTTTIISIDMNDNHHQRGISSLNSVITSKRTKESTMSSSDLSELGEDMDDHFVTATEEIPEPNRISNRSLRTSTDLENSDDDDDNDEEIVEISRRRNKRQKIRNLDDDGDSEFHTDNNNNNQRDTSNNNIDLDIDEDDSIIISEEVPIIRRSERNGNHRHIGDSNSGSTRGSTTPGTGSNSVFQSEGIEIQELDSDNDNNDNDINDGDGDITTTTSGSRSNNNTSNKDEIDEDADDIIIISSTGEIEKSKTTIDLLNDSVENTVKELKDVVCPICFEPFEKCVVMSCGHLYCSDCIYETLASSKIRNVNQGICALCRKTVFYKDLVWLKLRYKK